MTRFLRPALIGIAGASVLAVGGCAGRGSIPEIATLAPYNGAWSLEAFEPWRGVQFISPRGSGFVRGTGQHIVATMGIRPEALKLEVTDSIFRVTSDEPGFSFSLPIDGTPVEVLGEDGAVEQSITLRWDNETPIVRRTFPGTGWISDRFELTEAEALMVTRTAAMTNNRGADVVGTGAVQIAYVRSTGSQP